MCNSETYLAALLEREQRGAVGLEVVRRRGELVAVREAADAAACRGHVVRAVGAVPAALPAATVNATTTEGSARFQRSSGQVTPALASVSSQISLMSPCSASAKSWRSLTSLNMMVRLGL